MNTLGKFFGKAVFLGVFCLGLALSGCGGSGSYSGSMGGTGTASTDCSNPQPGNPQACVGTTLTDANGDFLTYTVNVTSLTLVRADGTVVQVLPNTTTVDFAQYTDIAEFFTLGSVPPGTYTSASMTLDYSNADIEVENNGSAVKVSPVDASGNPIATLTVQVNLSGHGPLLLVPGVPQLFSLDFDLNASNQVNLGNDTVAVSPVLYAQVDANIGKNLRVRGPLTSVNTGGSYYTIGLRPFYNAGGDFGANRVYITSNTTFLINGQGYLGSQGLQALQSAGAGTAVVAQGTYNFSQHQYVATEVNAGSSVPGGTLDAVEGVVTAVNGGGTSFTVRGATLIRAQGSAVFNDNVTVNVGPNTRVREVSDPGMTATVNDISVGQHMLFLGTLTNTSPGSLTLDATGSNGSGGFALLKHTRVGATVNSTASGSLNVNVLSFDGRAVSLFNFAGTGSNPLSYLVDTGNLPLATINPSDPVDVDGFVSPYGSAPPDFNADSVADFANANALLAVGWISVGGSTAPFTTLNSTGLVVNLSNPGSVHVVRQGPVITTLTAGTAPTLVANTNGGVFVIRQSGVVTIHLNFADFVTDLTGRLSAGAVTYGVFGVGQYNNATGIFTATRLAVVMK